MKKQLTVLAVLGVVLVAAVCACRRARHPRAGPRQGERRHHHQDRPRGAADCRPPAEEPQRCAPTDEAALKAALVEVTPGVIVDAVDELLMVQRGKELGYTMSTEQFASIVENIKKENKIESDDQLADALKQEGMTMADLRKQLERQMLISRVQQTEIMAKLQVTDAELKIYYEAQQGRVQHRSAGDAARDPDRRARQPRRA